MDNIRNEYIRGIAQMGRFGKKIREVRLRWFGYVRMKVGPLVQWDHDADDGTARKYETEKT